MEVASAGQVSMAYISHVSKAPYTTESEVTITPYADPTGLSSTAYYSLDGTAPVVEYSAPFKVSRTTMIRAYATKPGHFDSEEILMNYTIQAAEPVFCPNSANTTGVVEHITIVSPTPDTDIHYTTDGSEPTASSAKLDPWSWIDWSTVGTFTFKAVAVRAGIVSSTVSSAAYTVMSGTVPNVKVTTPIFEIAGDPVTGGDVLQGSTLDIIVPAPDDDAALYWTAEVGEWTERSGKQPSLCETSLTTTGGTWKTALPGRVSVQFSISPGRSITIKALAYKNGHQLSSLKVGTFNVLAQNQFELRTARSKLVFNTKKMHTEDAASADGLVTKSTTVRL